MTSCLRLPFFEPECSSKVTGSRSGRALSCPMVCFDPLEAAGRAPKLPQPIPPAPTSVAAFLRPRLQVLGAGTRGHTPGVPPRGLRGACKGPGCGAGGGRVGPAPEYVVGPPGAGMAGAAASSGLGGAVGGARRGRGRSWGRAGTRKEVLSRRCLTRCRAHT